MKGSLAEKKKINLAGANATILFLILFVVVVGILRPNFFSIDNLGTVLRNAAVLGTMASGITLVMLTGNTDLSSGAVLTFSGVIAANAAAQGSTLMAFFWAIVIGGGCGLVNGILVGKLKLNAFVSSLGMKSVLFSLALMYTGNKYITITDNPSYQFIGAGNILGIPFLIIFFLIVVVIVTIISKKTVLGTRIFAVGSNPVSARFCGINPGNVVICAYIIGGITCGLGGILMSSKAMAAQYTMGTGYEFEVLTAVALGGLSVAGGKGSVPGTILGAVFVTIIKNGLVFLGVDSNVQYVALGVLLILSIWIDMLKERRLG